MRVTAILLFASATVFVAAPSTPVTVADISQHPVVRLTYNDGIDWMPTISAGGNRLAWSGPQPGSRWLLDIYVADRVSGAWQQPVSFGETDAREWFADLSNDGDTIVYAGGHYSGLSDEIHLRRWLHGSWGPPAVIANARDMGFWSVERPVISGDGLTVVARFSHISIYHCFVTWCRNGVWSASQRFGARGRHLAISENGTRVCVGKSYGEDELYMYDFLGPGVTAARCTLEDPTPVSIGCLSMSDHGKRAAYRWWPHPPYGRSWVRLREECDGMWDLTEFSDFVTGVLSGDGRTLLLVRSFGAAHICLTRFLDGEWHEPICIAHTASLDDRRGGPPALSRHGDRIAFAGEEVARSSESQEIYFLEYDFPGKAVVESNIPNAPFTLSGPIELSRTTGPDCRWECDQLYVSTWTVTWGDVPYYETPPAQTQRTKIDKTVHFWDEYIPSIYRLQPTEVELSIGTPVLNYATGTFFVPVEIRNITEDTTFLPPMRLIFDSFSPENTRLWNGDGFTDDGKPFIDLSDLVPDGLAPDSPPLLVEMEIYNRERNPFISFEAHVTAAKAPPPDAAFTTQTVEGDSASFEVRQSEKQSALSIESITLDVRGVKIAWRSVAGQNYRVLRSDDLLSEWQNTAEVMATGPTTEWIDESASEESPPMRIYRIERIPSPAPNPADR